MKKHYNQPIIQSFNADIGLVIDEIKKDTTKSFLGYMIYAAIETKEGEEVHISGFSSADFDSLIGRLELMKSTMIEEYKRSRSPDSEIDNTTLDLLKQFQVKKDDKPN